MNILMLISAPIPSCEGIVPHVLGLGKQLRQRGHEVTLMTRGGMKGQEEINHEGFSIIKVPFLPLYPLHVIMHRYNVLRALDNLKFKPDIVHLHTPLVPYLPKKWPLVTTFHTPMLSDTASVEDYGIRSRLIKIIGKTTSFWVEKELLRNSDCIITVSYAVADELRKYYHYEGDNLFPILNAVDTSFFKPGTPAESSPYLLYIGRMDFRKGLFDLIASARIVADKFREVSYYLVGNGPLEEPLKKAVKEAGLGKNIKFCGVVHDRQTILKYYQEARAIIIPSHYEGLPMVMIEAMACGKPLICTNASFSKGILEDGKNALLVNPKSPAELAAATIRLLSDDKLCRDLGVAARKTAEAKFGAEVQADQVLEVYRLARERFKQLSKIECRE